MRIKICGVTTVDDALLAAQLGADAVGLNFFPGSKRYVDAATAAAIVRSLPPPVEPVGVFVNAVAAEALTLPGCPRRLPCVQLHAAEHHQLPDFDCRWVTAFGVCDRNSLAVIDDYLGRCRHLGRLPDAILVDAHAAGEFGGTGRCAPWALLADYHPGVPLILAGGLTPDNVAEAIRIVRPEAVDVASGVEHAPGRKDAEKMRRFIDRARSAAAG